MFKTRSYKLERIDTGDYTPEEYEVFLREIAFINRVLGDNQALKKTLLKEIELKNLREFSVLDVGAGSGELLRAIAKFSRKQNRKTRLYGLELNARSAVAILKESKNYMEIRAVRGDAFQLPFADDSFDYAICSLFTHHFIDEKVVRILEEMNRVARRKIFVIDLHRHRAAYNLYKIFCVAFRISPLVREDGLLSILRSFKPDELKQMASEAFLENVSVERHFPFRLILEGKKSTGD
ncbi:MAG TPA: methyltransferase domain-containing protein [Pyrinomonadaceae bacterium]|nr:methyltransferase domain-containing protein [Pyrinomonadaceae bacterium]